VPPEMPPSFEQWPTRASDTDILAAHTLSSEPTIRLPVARPGVPPKRARAVDRQIAVAAIVLGLVVLIALAGWLLMNRGSQNPAPSAAGTVAVPRLVGLTEQAAVIRLANAGFKPRIRERTTGPRDGLVASQLPLATVKLAPDAVVTLFVDRLASTATATKPKPVSTTTTAVPATTTVPDVSNDTEQAAVQALNNANLVPSLFFVPSHDPLGTVEGQAKLAGSQAAATAPIQINISKGPGQNPAETVPSVIGMSLDAALASINAQGLRLIYLKQPIPTPSGAGTISRQSPLPGAHVPRNGQVLVYLAAFTSNG
jgi:beta-lactam-binding protein with PASTA domain